MCTWMVFRWPVPYSNKWMHSVKWVWSVAGHYVMHMLWRGYIYLPSSPFHLLAYLFRYEYAHTGIWITFPTLSVVIRPMMAANDLGRRWPTTPFYLIVCDTCRVQAKDAVHSLQELEYLVARVGVCNWHDGCGQYCEDCTRVVAAIFFCATAFQCRCCFIVPSHHRFCASPTRRQVSVIM